MCACLCVSVFNCTFSVVVRHIVSLMKGPPPCVYESPRPHPLTSVTSSMFDSFFGRFFVSYVFLLLFCFVFVVFVLLVCLFFVFWGFFFLLLLICFVSATPPKTRHFDPNKKAEKVRKYVSGCRGVIISLNVFLSQ